MGLNKRKKLFFILATIFVTISLILPVLFIVAQVYIKSSRNRDLQFIGDAFTNYRQKPNQTVYPGKGWFHSDDRKVHINSLGLRGSEIQLIKQPGTFRIAVLGGSAVYDMNVSDDQTFTSKLQEILRKRTGKEIEVINCGVPGWSTVHSLVNYMFRIRYLKPDVIIVYHTWNDIKYFQYLHDGFDMPRYFFPYDENKERYLTGNFPFAQIDALKIMFISAIAKLRGSTVIETGRNPFTDKRIQAEQIFDVTIFENSLTDLVHLAKLDGVSVLLSTQANLAYDNTLKEDRDRIWYSYVNTDHYGLVRAINLANDVIFQVGKKEDVPVVDVYKSMVGKSECFNDHVHLIAVGCEEIAKLLSNRIVELYFTTKKGR